MAAGHWQHVAITYDGLLARVYLNGVLDVEKNISHPVSDAYNTLYIGGLPNSEGKMTFPGAIDELELTNTSLSASEVAGLAAASGTATVAVDTTACGVIVGAPLVGGTGSGVGNEAQWSFDNVSGAMAFNTKFAALHASLNSVSVVPGVMGQALQFDSSLNQSYAEINVTPGGAATWPHFPDAHISVAMWINPTRIEAGATYHLFGGGYFGGQSFHVRIVDGKLALVLNALNTGGSGEDLIVQSSASVAPGHWQHVAVTYDGLIARVYLNGMLDVAKNISHPVSDAYNTLYIGGLPNSEGNMTFPGAVDELKLTNTSLSPSAVAALTSTSGQRF